MTPVRLAPVFVALALSLALSLVGCRTGRSDVDRDGLKNDANQCSDDPEDFDGFEDEDGCPDPDNDADGFLDVNDRCPTVPGPADAGGCPAGGSAQTGGAQERDMDGDAVLDDTDVCPAQPEDKDGFADHDGCPDPDNDGDGALDTVDPCPNVAGAKGGCP